jgi:trimeric autotransporter adhesin
LDFIMQLRPVTYQFDVKRFDSQLGLQNTDNASYNEAELLRRTGFIAQEVEKAATSTGYNFSGVIKPVKQGDHYSLSYDAFVVPLVKAVQEQQQVIDQQQDKMDQQQNKIEQQDKKINALEQQLQEIKKLLQTQKK